MALAETVVTAINANNVTQNITLAYSNYTNYSDQLSGTLSGSKTTITITGDSVGTTTTTVSSTDGHFNLNLPLVKRAVPIADVFNTTATNTTLGIASASTAFIPKRESTLNWFNTGVKAKVVGGYVYKIDDHIYNMEVNFPIGISAGPNMNPPTFRKHSPLFKFTNSNNIVLLGLTAIKGGQLGSSNVTGGIVTDKAKVNTAFTDPGSIINCSAYPVQVPMSTSSNNGTYLVYNGLSYNVNGKANSRIAPTAICYGSFRLYLNMIWAE